MTLTTYHKLSHKRGTPRFWVESPRLQHLGFVPRTYFTVEEKDGTLCLRPSTAKTRHRVSFRLMSGLPCPIIDINSKLVLGSFAGHTEMKVDVTYNQLTAKPSVRSFNILTHRTAGIPVPTLEYFAGGSTLSQAITGDPRFKMVGAVEISPKFAAHFAMEHPDVPLYQCDIRDLNPNELPRVGFMFASLPCTCFSTLGVAKKKLKDSGSEVGDTGDLFMSFVHHVATHMPLAVMVENVPQFFGNTAIAGRVMMAHLERLGYHVQYFDLMPHAEWAEPQDRRRGVMVATLFGKFFPHIPMTPFTGRAGDYLDAPDPVKDREDAEAIAKMIEGRRKHQERHRAAGNGFGFSVINHESPKIPTICRSYHKVNAGPFVETPYGLRMLRLPEIERIMGFTPAKEGGMTSPCYSTGVEILGQGVQTRIFRQLIRQLGDYLEFMITQGRVPSAPEYKQVS